MNTEHTKHPCETVDASADVMKLAEMILSDCGCSTAISDRLQRRVAGRIQLQMDSVAQQLELERGSLFAESQRKQQLQGQVDALMEAMAKISRMTMSMYTSAGEAMRDAKRIAHEAIAAAEQAQAEPVELRSVFDQMFDYSVDPTDDVSREWLWRFSKGLVGRLSSKQPAVAVPGAVDLLREMEWENNRFADACPVCASSREQGHTANCKLAAVLAAAPQATAEDSSVVGGAGAAPAEWPTAQDVGRIGDMSKVASLRVGLDADNDVYVSIANEEGMADVEFCVPGSGGGKSPRTRAALISLMVAMEADNAETPSRDWWKAREGDEQKGGAG